MMGMFRPVSLCPQQAETQERDLIMTGHAVYVASRAAKAAFALQPDHVIETCYYGPAPLADARQYAYDETKATDSMTYVYKVTIEAVAKYEVKKEVVGSVHTF